MAIIISILSFNFGFEVHTFNVLDFIPYDLLETVDFQLLDRLKILVYLKFILAHEELIELVDLVIQFRTFSFSNEYMEQLLLALSFSQCTEVIQLLL